VFGWLQRIWAIALAAPLGAHAYVGWFSRYTSDDFCTAGIALSQGFLQAQTYWYSAWSGRYSFTALVSALELSGPWTTQVLPALAVIAWVAAGTWAIEPLARLHRWPRPRLAAFVVAELIAATTLTAAPNVGQSFYWQTGLLTYTLPLILVTLFTGWVIRHLLADDARVSAWAMAASGVAGFLIGGLSETTLVVQTAALGLGLVLGLAFLSGRRRRLIVELLAPALLGSILAGGVMLMAPGTRVRASQEQDPELNLGRAVLAARASLSLAVWVLRRFEVLSRSTFIFLLLASATLGFAAAIRSLPSASRVPWPRTLALIALVALLGYAMEALSLFPVYLVQGFDPPGRVQLVAVFVLVIALTICAYLGGGLLGQMIGRWAVLRQARPVAAVMLALLALVPLSEALITLGQVPVEAAYAMSWDNDDRALRDAHAASAPLAVVEPLPARWGWAYVDTRPDAFPNGCVARYYGLPQVIASGRSPVWTGAPEKGGNAPGG
jgi:hypothetical protein